MAQSVSRTVTVVVAVSSGEMFWVVICFGIFIVLSFTCLLALICKKYRNMKHNYDRLLENPGRSSDMRVGQGIGEVDHGEVELSNV